MKKTLSVLTGMVFTGCILSAPLTAQSADDENALWEKFLRYDLCITDYDALTEEEQQLCHFIFDVETSFEDTVRCERARRTLAHDPNIGGRITFEQAEAAYGIGDMYSSMGMLAATYGDVHCVPDIICLDEYNYYADYWLGDSDNDMIRVVFDNPDYWGMFERITDGVHTKFAHKMGTPVEQAEDGTLYTDISDSPDIVTENGDYYWLFPDGTASLLFTHYTHLDYLRSEPVTEPFTVPESVQGHTVAAIGAGAFHYANVTEVRLPDTVQYICCAAFEECEQLKKINFPDGLKLLGTRAFAGTALEHISINSPELYICDKAFGSRSLQTADLNVKSIGEDAFTYCPNLQTLRLGDALEKLEANAFYNPNAVQKLVLPDSVRVLGRESLKGFSAVEVPPGVEIFGALPKQQGKGGFSLPEILLTAPPKCVFSENAIIYGETGSSAEEYADEWELTFIPLDVQAGTPAGLKLLSCWLAGMPGAEITDPEAYDLNGDGILNAVDLSLMKQSV